MYGLSNGMVSAMEEKHKSRKWKQHRVRGKGSVRNSLNEKVNPMLSEGRAWLGEEAETMWCWCPGTLKDQQVAECFWRE